jgi:hypothetical protein
MRTPLEITEFSTVPSMIQSSAIREFFTEAPVEYTTGAELCTLVKIGRSLTPRRDARDAGSVARAMEYL